MQTPRSFVQRLLEPPHEVSEAQMEFNRHVNSGDARIEDIYHLLQTAREDPESRFIDLNVARSGRHGSLQLRIHEGDKSPSNFSFCVIHLSWVYPESLSDRPLKGGNKGLRCACLQVLDLIHEPVPIRNVKPLNTPERIDLLGRRRTEPSLLRKGL